MSCPNMKQKSSLPFQIFVIAVLLVVIAYIAVPDYSPSKNRGANPKSTCIANLKQLDSAIEQWSKDSHKLAGSRVKFSDLIGADQYIKSKPTYPSGGIYVLHGVGKSPTCTC